MAGSTRTTCEVPDRHLGVAELAGLADALLGAGRVGAGPDEPGWRCIRLTPCVARSPRNPCRLMTPAKPRPLLVPVTSTRLDLVEELDGQGLPLGDLGRAVSWRISRT